MESVALRLITGLGNSEVMPSLTRYTFCSDTKPNLISTDSEELNRVLVLTMARAIHVTGERLSTCFMVYVYSNSLLPSLLLAAFHAEAGWEVIRVREGEIAL